MGSGWDNMTTSPEDEPGLKGHESFRRHLQWDWFSCGMVCTYMVLQHFGRRATRAKLRAELDTTIGGTSSHAIMRTLRAKGFRAWIRYKMPMTMLEFLLEKGGLFIADMDGGHFAVVYATTRPAVYVADPSLLSSPCDRHTREQFRSRWTRSGILILPRV